MASPMEVLLLMSSDARSERISARQRNPKWKSPPLLIDMSICINCDTCIRHCPPQFGAIFNHGIDVIIIPELCSGCEKCIEPLPGRLHLPRSRLDARGPRLVGRAQERRSLLIGSDLQQTETRSEGAGGPA